MNYRILVVILFVSVMFSGCAPKINLKNDVFQGKPLWESNDVFPIDKEVSIEKNIRSTNSVSGLSLLVDQVIPEHSPALTDGIIKTNEARALRCRGEKDRPLPPEIAELKVTKAYVRSLWASTQPSSSQTKGVSQTGAPVLDQQLTIDDFKDFGKAMMKAGLSLYQDGDKARMDKLSSFLNDGEITWEGIAHIYFVAYFMDEFVDRTGSAVGRPKLSIKVTNETLAAFVSVGLESIYDYALIGDKSIKNPVVWKEVDGKAIWQTAGGKKPTFVTVIQKLQGVNSTQPTDLRKLHGGYVEPLEENDKPGINKKKLELIRLSSGYAGDIAGSAIDLIIREFGGINIGFVVFGRFSVGDNDSLAKLIQTITEIIARRSTESFVATYLYDRKVPDDKAIVMRECVNKSSVDRLLGICK